MFSVAAETGRLFRTSFTTQERTDCRDLLPREYTDADFFGFIVGSAEARFHRSKWSSDPDHQERVNREASAPTFCSTVTDNAPKNVPLGKGPERSEMHERV